MHDTASASMQRVVQQANIVTFCNKKSKKAGSLQLKRIFQKRTATAVAPAANFAAIRIVASAVVNVADAARA